MSLLKHPRGWLAIVYVGAVGTLAATTDNLGSDPGDGMLTGILLFVLLLPGIALGMVVPMSGVVGYVWMALCVVLNTYLIARPALKKADQGP